MLFRRDLDSDPFPIHAATVAFRASLVRNELDTHCESSGIPKRIAEHYLDAVLRRV